MAKDNYCSENKVIAPRIEENEIPSGTTYRARFIVAGAVGYADGVYYLPQYAIDDFAWTLKGKPVILGHQDILDEEDMKSKAVGYVSRVDRDDEGGWWADFVIFDSKAIKKIEDGDASYVSCGYRAELTDEDTKINNVDYKKKIVGGEMLHLALVKNPRYNGTEVWRNSTDDYVVSEAVLYNLKENIMFGFKKTKVELDKDTLVNTSFGEKTIEELINDVEESHKTIEELNAKLAEAEAKAAAPVQEAAPVEEAPATPAEATEEIQPKVEEGEGQPKEEAPKAESEETDADFKKDLNNAVNEEIKPAEAVVIEVPDFSIN